MVTLFSTFIIAIVLIVFFINTKKGLILFLIALLYSPYMTVFGIAFRIELLLIPLLLVVLVLKRARSGIKWPFAATLMYVLWLWFFLATTVQLINGNTNALLWVNIYSFLRPLFVIFIFYNIAFDYDEVNKLIRLFVFSAIPLGLLTLGQSMGSDFATWLTIESYSSSARTPIHNLIQQTGAVTRGVAVFESPVYAATYFLLSLGTSLFLLIQPPTKMIWQTRLLFVLSAIFATIGGIFTLSATFIAGIVVLFIWLIIQLKGKAKLRFMVMILILMVVLLPLVTSFLETNPIIQGSLRYQLYRVSSFSLFETRFNQDTGILIGTINAIFESPFIGWGWNTQDDVFLGDSVYTVILYYGGMVGLFLFVITLLSISWLALRNGVLGQIVLLWLIILLATGLGNPSFFIPRLDIWWWALVGISTRIASTKYKEVT